MAAALLFLYIKIGLVNKCGHEIDGADINTSAITCPAEIFQHTHAHVTNGTYIYVKHRHILCTRRAATVLCHVICGDVTSHLSRWQSPRISPLTPLVPSVMQNVTVQAKRQ
jgi:hypothetical protein